MKLNSRALTVHAAIILCIAYFLSFIIYYIDSYIFEKSLEAVRYIADLIYKLTYFLLPAAAALLSFAIWRLCSLGKGVASLAFMTLPRFFYTLPQHYLKLLPEGFDSLESLGFGALFSLLEAVIAYLISALIAVIFYLVSRYIGKNDEKESFFSTDPFDLTSSVSLSLAVFSVLPFLYFIIRDIIDTVNFLNTYSSYKPNEIIMIVVFFLFDILALVLHYFLLFYTKAFALAKYGEE